jgi:hypothetical protein
VKKKLLITFKALNKKLLLCLILLMPATADNILASAASRILTWQDLIPLQTIIENPFNSLPRKQRYQLALLAQIRESIANGKSVNKSTIVSAKFIERELTAGGLDVESLLIQRSEFIARRRASAFSVVHSLDGQYVRIPGYLLPLEHDNIKVTEFLLVPYVGACIHAPPPPPNQILYVRFSAGYKLPKLFSAVWVEGKIHVSRSDQKLFLVDGSSDIPVSYYFVASKVEIYRK